MIDNFIYAENIIFLYSANGSLSFFQIYFDIIANRDDYDIFIWMDSNGHYYNRTFGYDDDKIGYF